MVSIIIPYIDEHHYLAEALTSAAGQQEVEAEIILVCNAPSLQEGIVPVMDPEVKYNLIHEPRRGSAYARNAGLHAAKGEWVQFLDVDDLLHPDKILHQLAHTDADVVVSPHTYLFLNGKKENSKWLPEDIWTGMLNSGLGSTSSMLWKRDALVSVGGWNTAYASHQEYELLFRLARAGKKIVTDDHCETMVRQRKQGSITSASGPVRPREGIRLREAMWDHLKEKALDTPERYEAFRQYVFRQLRGLFRQDRQEAMHVFNRYFSTGRFIPKDIHVPGYRLLYSTLGFETTEKLIFWMVRPWL